MSVPLVQTVDDADPGFTTAGAWSTWSGPSQGYRNAFHYSNPGTGADVATWTFSGLTPGRYRVSATWTPYTNRATDT
ncbi:MAG TPA: hypothetical protein VF590_18600, partial [Isosphaeraceae bacterium]